MAMLFLFLTILSCDALKLAEPIYLRDVDATEDNSSLRAWCQGTGCVMPFTPKSCLSWCDWNYDKQADAEARGAFGAAKWATKQKLPTDFSINFCDPVNAETSCDTEYKMYFMQIFSKGAPTGGDRDKTKDIKTDGDWKTTHVPIYPGGDAEKLLGNTVLACDACYVVQSTTANAGDVKREFSVQFIKSPADAAQTRIKVFEQSNTNKCTDAATLMYWVDVPAFANGAPRTGEALATQGPAWVNNAGAWQFLKFVHVKDMKEKCTDTFKDGAANEQNVHATGKKCDATKTRGQGGGMTTVAIDANSEPDNTAGNEKYATRKACCETITGHATLGFALSPGLGWPTCP